MSKLFAITTRDKPDALAIRQATRPTHLEFLKGLGDDMLLAGPFTDEAGSPIGSLIVIKAASLEAAKEIAGNDPYVAAGLFASSEVTPWVWAVNAPEGL